MIGLESMEQEVRAAYSVGMAKRAYRDQRKAKRKLQRQQWLREARCFWTWPFKHEWTYTQRTEDEQTVNYRECVGCHKRYRT